MRKLFIKQLVQNSNKKKNYLLINDLGYNVIEPFKKKFPDRIFNAGVSEQNMMGMAAGIASEKCNVFVYSIANFSTFCSTNFLNLSFLISLIFSSVRQISSHPFQS